MDTFSDTGADSRQGDLLMAVLVSAVHRAFIAARIIWIAERV